MQMDLQTSDKEESKMSQLFGMDNIVSSLKGNYENKVNNEKTANHKGMIGNPKLSETATSYYEDLKSKYSDVEFVLVDNNSTDVAKEYASNLVSNKSMIVLISADEVEQMATDETTRSQNEKLIEDAKAQMPDLLAQLKESGVNVKSFGMEFNKDGTASYFAVVDKSMAAQRERIENNIEENRAAKKEAAKENAAERLENKHLHRKEELTTITSSSMEDLISKIKDVLYEAKADSVITEQEKMIGQHFDLSL